ncbi:MAG: HAD hydrolase family protein [Gammaproteobacteria bacterium]|nr:HAD hydrolase family protein [Gammaproteobacteria bacterium]
MPSTFIPIEKIDALVFDFDGVLTDNRVLVNQEGVEFVSCSRGDGLAFDVLRKIKKPVFILSTEENSVVTTRGDKLKVPVIQGVKNKVTAIKSLAETNNFNLKNILYIGNDLNDYYAMGLCGYSACPSDSHNKIKQIAKVTLTAKGGAGVARELLEDVLQIDFLTVLYTNQ